MPDVPSRNTLPPIPFPIEGFDASALNPGFFWASRAFLLAADWRAALSLAAAIDAAGPRFVPLLCPALAALRDALEPTGPRVPPSRPELAALRAVLGELVEEERGALEPTGPRVPLSLDVEVEVRDPAAFDVLVEAGLFADPPLIAPDGGNDGSPIGPRS